MTKDRTHPLETLLPMESEAFGICLRWTSTKYLVVWCLINFWVWSTSETNFRNSKINMVWWGYSSGPGRMFYRHSTQFKNDFINHCSISSCTDYWYHLIYYQCYYYYYVTFHLLFTNYQIQSMSLSIRFSVCRDITIIQIFQALDPI